MAIRYSEYRDNDDPGLYAEHTTASSNLSAAVKKQFETMRRHRDGSGISDRLMSCLRQYQGEYSAEQLQAITQFGGSDTFARITGVKCRTLAALLEELYLGPERPWRIDPTPIPTLPENIAESIQQMILGEVAAAQQAGEQIQPEKVMARLEQMHKAALQATKIKADNEAKLATERLDDQLQEGGFYTSFRDFLINFSIYPFAVLKGPFFTMGRKVKYVEGMPTVVEMPIMSYSAPSPFDIWFSPGVSRPDEGDIVERERLSRFDVEALRNAPTYDAEAIDAFLGEFPTGHSEWTSNVEQSRANEEERESPILNDSELYDVISFHGWIDGVTLNNEPLFDEYDLEEDRAHHVTVRMLGSVVIGAHPNPDPMERSIFHVSSFEQVPGSVIGRGLPESLVDAQALANSAMRAVVNNMGLACLTGDTVVYRHRKGRTDKGCEVTLSELWAQKHQHNSGLKRNVLRAIDEGTGKFTGSRVVDIVDNGVRDVFEITTAGGYVIKATDNHRFLASNGRWHELANFAPGEEIAVNGAVVPLRTTCLDCEAPLAKPTAIRCRKCAAQISSWNHDQARRAVLNRNASATTARGRKLVQAQRKAACEACGGTTRLHIHHIDKDPWNCAPANLKTLCEPCHKAEHKYHDSYGNARLHTYLSFDRIIAIVHKGEQQVYDLCMEEPHHNFVANGFISHNSGPQVGINTQTMNDNENAAEMYPWKRWVFTPDPAAPSTPPITFFQPQDNSQALLAVLDRAMMYADEVSAIPRYAAGSGASGGAQRTASGLAMLQGNAAKVVKFIAKGIDRDVVHSVLDIIYSMSMLTDTTGMFRGDESIKVLGVEYAAKQDADKMRAIEMLQITANPIDIQILGPQGRGLLLAEMAKTLGFDHEMLAKVIEQNVMQAAQAAAQQGAPGGGLPGAPGEPPGGGPGGSPASLPNPPARPGAGGGRVQAPQEGAANTMRRPGTMPG